MVNNFDYWSDWQEAERGTVTPGSGAPAAPRFPASGPKTRGRRVPRVPSSTGTVEVLPRGSAWAGRHPWDAAPSRVPSSGGSRDTARRPEGPSRRLNAPRAAEEPPQHRHTGVSPPNANPSAKRRRGSRHKHARRTAVRLLT